VEIRNWGLRANSVRGGEATNMTERKEGTDNQKTRKTKGKLRRKQTRHCELVGLMDMKVTRSPPPNSQAS